MPAGGMHGRAHGFCTTIHRQRLRYRQAKRESLISATIFDSNAKKGATTNNFGYYSLTLPAGEVSLAYSYIGYRTENQNFHLQGDTVLNIRLDQDNMLEEVTVTGRAISSTTGNGFPRSTTAGTT